MEVLKHILTRPLLVLLVLIQCAFLVFTLVSAPKANGHLHTAISSLRTPSQSNIARIDQNDARELKGVLEGLIQNNKFVTIVTVLFSFISLVLIAAMMFLPLAFKRAPETTVFDAQLKL